MKCAKSRNAKNALSSSRSLGTVPGWRVASSLTMRADADPTGWTWSSALGRPWMKPAWGVSGAEVTGSLKRVQQVLCQLVDGPTLREGLAVDDDRRGALDAEVLGGVGARGHELRALARLHGGLQRRRVGPGLGGQRIEVVTAGEGTVLARLVRVEQV